MARLLKIYDGTAWVELAKKSDIPSLSGYATQQWVGNNYLPLSGGTLTGSLQIYSTGSSWNEGVRLHAASNGWSGVVFCDTANTGDTGSSANTWSIHNYEGVFGAFKNGSNIGSVGVGFAHDGSNWQFKGGDIYVNSSGRLAYASEIPTNTNQLTNGAGFITSGDIPSSLPANGGNADTVDGYHAASFAFQGGDNNLIGHGNEFTFVPSGYTGDVYFNYRTAGGTNGSITSYILGNGAGGSLGTIIHSGNIGSQSVNYADSAGAVAWANVSGRPTDLGDFTNNAGYIKGIDSSMVTTALGYTPANSSSLSNYLPTSGGTITNSGSPLLTLKRNTNGGAFIGFKSSNQDTYIWYNGSTSSNALRFSYSSDGGSTSTKKMELDNSGNLEVVGSISEAGTALSNKYYAINNPNNYISGINSTMIVNALGYTPYQKPSGGIPNSDIASANTWNAKQDALTFDNSPTANSSNPVKSGGVYTALSLKQATLVSGNNIKTINGQSILGSGNVTISGGGWSTELYMHTINFPVNMGGTYFGAASITLVCDVDEVFTDLDSISYYMNYNGPDYNEDLPYVGLIPASGFLYGGSRRYTIYGACYINRNGYDYIRLAAVSDGGSVEYFDMQDSYIPSGSVMTDYMIRIN